MAVARAREAKPAQVALAWLLAQPGVVAPIVGASKVEHLDDLAAARRAAPQRRGEGAAGSALQAARRPRPHPAHRPGRRALPLTRPGCPECGLVAAGTTPLGAPVLRRGPFVVHARPEPSPVPGWLFVAPARHVEQIDALDTSERAALGPLLAEVAEALRAETPCAKVYVSVFAEVLHHCHFHVVARPPDHPEEERGPRLFASERQADPARALTVARRVHQRLSTSPASPSRWRSVLLSGLVWPGLGQLVSGHVAKGLSIVAGTLAAFAWLCARVAGEVFRRMPSEPTILDLGEMLEMAAAIRRDNAAFFSGITFVLVGLWVVRRLRRLAHGARATRPASSYFFGTTTSWLTTL